MVGRLKELIFDPRCKEIRIATGYWDLPGTNLLYEDIHGMGMEALMQMFDEYLGEEEKSEMPKCEHHQVRTSIIPEVARLIAEHLGISENEALDRFYKSATAQNLADEENGLYGQSALFIFGQYLEEMEMRS